MQQITQVALLVKAYDEAIEFYTRKLSFILLEDTVLSETKRWVRIAPKDSGGFALLLAKAEGNVQTSQVGNQAAGRVFLFLHTDHFQDEYQQMFDKGVEFVRAPVKEAWGTVAVFKDLYGNLWDLIGN